MGCCAPNKISEFEFIYNTQPGNVSNDENNSSVIIGNENDGNINKEGKTYSYKSNKINSIGNSPIEYNKIENNYKLKNEKIKDKEDSGFSLISSDEKDTTTKITDSDYENFISLYPSLTTKNSEKLEIKKNIILENKAVYYGEFNTEKNIKEGRGILIWPNGAKYTGYFQNNMQNIKGKMYHIDGDIYEGEWLNNKANGEGKFIHKGIIYEGQWKNDKQNGYGKETWKDGSYYEGNFINGKKEGTGKYVWADGSTYNGEFKDNAFNGKGKYIWENGREYNGDWVNGKMEGKGVFTWPDGRRFEGNYLNDKKEGYGEYYWNNGTIFRGMWKNGVQNGEGEIYEPKKNRTRKGIWEDGKRIKWIE